MGWSLSLCCIALLAPQDVTVLASTEGGFQQFSAPPAANLHGRVVFAAVNAQGVHGIHAASGTQVVPVALEGEPVVDGPDTYTLHAVTYTLKSVSPTPVLTSRGLCVFQAELNAGSAILGREGRGAPFQFIADSGEAFQGFGPGLDANNLDAVAFFATVDPPGHPDREGKEKGKRDTAGQLMAPWRQTQGGMANKLHEGLFYETGTELFVVAGTRGNFVDAEDGVAVNDRKVIACRVWSAPGRLSLVVHDGSIRPVATTGSRFLELGRPTLNNSGNVAFHAKGPSGESMVCRTKPGGALHVLFQDIPGQTVGDQAVITDTDDVFVSWVRDNEPPAILRFAPDGTPHPIEVDLSSSGFAEVVKLQLGPRADAGRGRLAVLATFADEEQAMLLLGTR